MIDWETATKANISMKLRIKNASPNVQFLVLFCQKNHIWIRTKEKRQLLSEMVLTNRIWMKRSCTNVLGRFSVKNIPTCA